MNKTEVIETLNRIMELELAGVVRYTHYALMVFGYQPPRLPLPMSNPTEIVSHWIDAQPEGTLISGQDLAHLISRDQASRQLAHLAKHGRLLRMARGVYVAVTASRLGPVPPPIDKVVQSLATITGRAVVRHGAAAANALGLTTQVPPPADAENQPLDSSARNLLIHKASESALCGLPATSGERGRSEECAGESENGRFRASWRWREVRRNPHQPAQVRGTSRKMPNCIHSWASLLVVGWYPASNDY